MNIKNNNLAERYSLYSFTDDRGKLIALEAYNQIPIKILRTYFIIASDKNTSRGFHAHRQLNQVAVCISGNCKIEFDNGSYKETHILNKPDTAIEIRPMIWHELHELSSDCILAIFADDIYKESDYIRNYDDFIKIVSDQKND